MSERLEVDDIYSEAGMRQIALAYAKAACHADPWGHSSWMGIPVAQLPEDLIAMANLIFKARPDAVVEVGIWKGGGCLFYASLLEAMGSPAPVVGVDIDLGAAEWIRGHRRIALVQGDSARPDIAALVKGLLLSCERPIVVLDSDHSKAHVLKELEIWSKLVAPGSYIVVFDGIIKHLSDAPGFTERCVENNPEAAVSEFLAGHPEFERDLSFNRLATYAPGGFLRRKA